MAIRRPLAAAGAAILLLGLAGTAFLAWQRGQAQAAVVTPTLGSAAGCASHSGVPEGFGRDLRAGMTRVPGGAFEPGTMRGYPDERPNGRVAIRPFWIDRTEVTNAQFAAFVEATGYRTWAEREGGAAVFRAPPRGVSTQNPMPWWVFVEGASWRHPEGPDSNLNDRDNHPVVHVAREDALAYARWLGRDLPTEDEWEWAARASGQPERLDREPRDAEGKPVANFWQGVFPYVDSAEDQHAGRAPVGCYATNGWGLHDMIGNVWEWTLDPYRGVRQPHGNGDPAAELKAAGITLPPGSSYVIKGGSYLCAASYCSRFRSTARHPMEDNLPTSHVGFRTVLR